MSRSRDNPYLGPRTFEERHSHLFFGRQKEARDLLSTVISEPLVFFYAPSGAGKSSLINARLVPGLRQEGFHVLPIGRIGGAPSDDTVPADNIYVHNLLASINNGQIADQDLPFTTLGAYVRLTRNASEDPELPIVLIVDQFEELVTTYQAFWQQRQAFFNQLEQVLDQDPLLWVVLSFREDFLATIEPYARHLPGQLLTRFQMQRMRHPAALEAIRHPAADHGRPFAEGVAEGLVDNLRQIRAHETDAIRKGEFVEPVQLQVVCYQLWENLKDKPQAEISALDVAELGDVDQALAEFYERTLAGVLALTGLTELELRGWFETQLITENQTRGTVFLGPEGAAGLESEVVRQLADRFLLRSEIRAGGTWYELVHDRLVSPVLASNAAWREAQGPVLLAAEAWQQSNRDPERLFEGAQLKEALTNLDKSTAEPLVNEFLAAGEAAQRRREEERARQLKEAQDEAERQKQRADEQARTSRRLRLLALGLLLVFVAALTLGVFAAIFAARSSRQAQEVAQLNSKAAQLNNELSQLVTANANLLTAAVSDDLEAVAEAQATADALSTAVAIAQATVDSANVAVNATATALTLNERFEGWAESTRLEHDDDVLGAAWSADETEILTWSGDDTARVWSAADEDELLRLEHDYQIWGAAWNADETAILTWGFVFTVVNRNTRGESVRINGAATIWSAADGDELLRLEHDGPVDGAVWNADETAILTWSDDGTARIWKAADGGELLRLDHDRSVLGAAWNGDETEVLTWSLDGTARVWRAADGRELLRLELAGPVDGAVWNADETAILTWSGEPDTGSGSARVWSTADGSELLRLEHDGSVYGAAWNRDETAILTWSGEPDTGSGSARVWSAVDGSQLLQLEHDDWVNGAVWNGEESQILTWSGEPDTGHGTARVWSAADGRELLQLEHDDGVRGAAWNGDDTAILTWSNDGTARVWSAAESR